MARKLSVRELSLPGETVFLRVDVNVPMKGGRIEDETRIVASLPTIALCREAGARVVLGSHLGRPDGKPKESLSLRPIAVRLAELLGAPVGFVDDCVGDKAERAARDLAPGGVMLLENLRFHPEEEANDAAFSKKLAALCTVYVNDAFGTAHRAHASTEGITHWVKASAAGLLMQKEIEYLGAAVGDPKRPYVAILGGAKVSDKIPILKNLAAKVDALLIGGGMAYTFLAARGIGIGGSLLEAGRMGDVEEVASIVSARSAKLVLPSDHVIARDVKADAEHRVVRGEIPPEWKGLDIGPETIAAYASVIREAGTILWNGPMGVFEMPPFAAGTFAVAQAVASSKAVSIVGGGDSIAAVNQAGVAARITHISTGGGASLELLAGETLPGIAALTEVPA
ncbi:MAG: phosphoglycerate kinase [Acidobacteriota bacterium]